MKQGDEEKYMRYYLEGEKIKFGETIEIGSKEHENSAIRWAKRLIKNGLYSDIRVFDTYECVWDSDMVLADKDVFIV